MGQVPIRGIHRHQYATGDVYYGNFDNSRRNGEGSITYSNGNKYEGNWLNDWRHGKGTMIYETKNDGETKLTSEDLLPHHVPNNPDSLVYRAYKRAQIYRQAYRKQQDEQSNVFLGTYDGLWLSDKRNAFGKFIYANNDIYYGEWSNDKRQGRGLILCTNKDEFEGLFQNNVKSGWGRRSIGCLNPLQFETLAERRTTTLEVQILSNLVTQLQNKLNNIQNKSPSNTSTFIPEVAQPATESTDASLSPTTEQKQQQQQQAQAQQQKTTIASPTQNNLWVKSAQLLLKQLYPIINNDKQQISQQTQDELILFHHPSLDIQKTQTIDDLLTYAIAEESLKQEKINKYNSTLISHCFEVEGYWLNDQLSGYVSSSPVTSPSSTNDTDINNVEPITNNQISSPSTTTTSLLNINNPGYAIVRRYLRISEQPVNVSYETTPFAYESSVYIDNVQTIIDNFSTHESIRYIKLKQGFEYFLCEIRIVTTIIAQRLVQTAGKIPLARVISQIEQEESLEPVDDEFENDLHNYDDENNNHTNNYEEHNLDTFFDNMEQGHQIVLDDVVTAVPSSKQQQQHHQYQSQSPQQQLSQRSPSLHGSNTIQQPVTPPSPSISIHLENDGYQSSLHNHDDNAADVIARAEQAIGDHYGGFDMFAIDDDDDNDNNDEN